MILVTKRDGSKEPLDIDKLHRVVTWACEDLTGVSVSEIELRSQLQFYNGIKTTDIQETLIKASADLISEETPNYQYVAGRLINYHLRKEVYGAAHPSTLLGHVAHVLSSHPGFYDHKIMDWYGLDEWAALDKVIKHDRDFDLSYAGMEQFRGKYLVRNRTTNKYLETPQMAYMLIAMTLFNAYTKDRLKWVIDYYEAISQHEISLPTPIMAGVRTPDRQFSSCVLIECDDSRKSIWATTGAVGEYVSERAGIGIGAGKIRAVGSPIRGGKSTHTGIINFWRLFQSATQSCNQGSIRKGSSTISFQFFHYEVEDLLVLKNNKGTEDNRLIHMDYCVQLNKLAYERFLDDGDITLFSPQDVPDLMEAFYADQDKFKELYEKYERSRVRKKTIKASEFFDILVQERKDTGRIYIQHIDHCNTHSSFKEELAPIKMTNLCTEVTLATKPLNDLNDPNGEIALCILSAINAGKIKSHTDMERIGRLAVRGLDALIDHQSYLLPASRNSALKRRPIGIGQINIAYWLAKNDTSYRDPNVSFVDEYAESYSYHLIKASIELAEEFGPCELWKETKYADGIMPHDTRKDTIDEYVPFVERFDWEDLRRRVRKSGIRNSTLMCGMPAETSAQIANATNGFEPIPAVVTTKLSQDGSLPQVAPESKKLKNKYDMKWEQPTPRGYLLTLAIFQKWMDQAISVNTTYNPANYPEGLSDHVMISDLIFAYSIGTKNLYYNNTLDGQGEIEDSADCDACAI